MKKINIYITEKQSKRLEKKRIETEESVASIIRQAINQYFEVDQ